MHSESLLRKILIGINSKIKTPEEKRGLIEQAAEDFHYIVKRWIKYQEKKRH
tara:strand:- start:776 stop:931 length:156 start_codon:yes stop_codon:yes gene_type:complete